MGDRKDTGFPSFLKGDQDGGWRHPGREEPFLMDRGFIQKISKPGKAGKEGAPLRMPWTAAGCRSTGVGISCVEKGIVSGAVEFRTGRPVGSRFRRLKWKETATIATRRQ